MTPFLLAGARPASGSLAGRGPGLAATARRVASTAAWHGWLRRWGLLAGYGLSEEPTDELRVCLVVRASNVSAALRLARDWETVSDYRVSVLSFTGEPSAGPLRSTRSGSGGGD